MSSPASSFAACRAPQARRRARNGCAGSGLAGFGDRYPHQMSGGMRKRLALAQTLILSPDILLMDEPFSALDVQTRQLMENELLALWAEDRKSVLFITHDLEEAIALVRPRRRAVGRAGTRPIGDFRIDLPRPRDVSEIRMTPAFLDAASRDLGRHEGRSAEGLSRAEGGLTAAAHPAVRWCSPCWSLLWYVFTAPGLIPPFYFEQDNRAAFFFGEPSQGVLGDRRVVRHGRDLQHLGVTLLETVLGFAIGAVVGPGHRPVAGALATPPRR